MATDYDAPRKNTEDDEVDSLEEVKAAAGKRASQQPDIDVDEAVAAENFELPGADLSGEELAVEVTPKRADEFTCSSCFLVRHRSQRAPGDRDLCLDCA